MGKTFYTDHDIEDLVKRGTMSLTLNDNIVLTDLAYEKARLLGMSLITAKYNSPPAAPVRPYLSKEQNNKSLPLKPAGALPFFSGESISYSPNQVVYNTKPTAPIENLQPGLTPLAKTTSVADGFPPGYPVAFSGHKLDKNQIRQQIIEKVNLRYGKIDQNLLDKIIQRALSNAGIE